MEQAETPSTSRGYYCHSCNNTISIPITNFLCPDCNQGFIEKLPDGPASASPFSERGPENRDDMDSDPVVVLNRVFDDISNNLEVYMAGGESNPRNNDNRPSSSSRRDTTSNSSRPNERRRGRNQYTGTFEQMLSEFLNSIPRTTQTFDGTAPVLLVGNPGDYAWGREGLDTIVTQLLNQMDSSGPPPLAKDKINELPFVSITAQQVSENMQCSVCWDSFKMTEKVRQLPCDHIYHDLCIVPWLELHGTCPICRKLLSDDNEARLGFPHTGGLEALLSDVHRLSILQQTYTPSTSTSTVRRGNARCYRCDKRGHYARDCTAPSVRTANSIERCYRCDGWGHIARNCTAPAQGSGSQTRRRRARGGSINRGWSASRHSPSRAAPLHEFLEVDLDLSDSGSDLFDGLSDTMQCGNCGLDSSDHPNDICNELDADTMFGVGSWDNDTVSPSGGSSSNSAANFVGYRQINDSPSTNTVANDRKRKITCYECNKPGHIARDCWEVTCMQCERNRRSCQCWEFISPPRRGNRGGGRAAYSRGAYGRVPTERCDNCTGNHSTWECWCNQSHEESIPVFGFPRGKMSRFPSSRRTNQRGDGSGPSTSRYSNIHDNYRCYQCHEMGHIARNCSTVKTCEQCGARGHHSRDCLNL